LLARWQTSALGCLTAEGAGAAIGAFILCRARFAYVEQLSSIVQHLDASSPAEQLH
jgi:hypothetical protein